MKKESVAIKKEIKIISKDVKNLNKKLKEDLIFVKRTEEAWKRYEKGEFKTMDADDFIRMLKKL